MLESNSRVGGRIFTHYMEVKLIILRQPWVCLDLKGSDLFHADEAKGSRCQNAKCQMPKLMTFRRNSEEERGEGHSGPGCGRIHLSK